MTVNCSDMREDMLETLQKENDSEKIEQVVDWIISTGPQVATDDFWNKVKKILAEKGETALLKEFLEKIKNLGILKI